MFSNVAGIIKVALKQKNAKCLLKKWAFRKVKFKQNKNVECLLPNKL